MEGKKSWLSYQLTQVLSGHSCFRDYLYKEKRVGSNRCHYCDAVDDVAHTVFVCPRWADEGSVMAVVVGEDITVDNLLDSMLDDGEKWKSIETELNRMIITKEREEREYPR